MFCYVNAHEICICIIIISGNVSEIAKNNEDKFKKMKDIYGKLREEHVQLLRTVSC